jgi:hypothetical protein
MLTFFSLVGVEIPVGDDTHGLAALDRKDAHERLKGRISINTGSTTANFVGRRSHQDHHIPGRIAGES